MAVPLPRFLRFLHRAGWEFWLPLPLIATCFWVAGNGVATQVLSRPYESVNQLQVNGQLDAKLSVTILALNAEINRGRGTTAILVKSPNSNLKKLEYEFPTTQASEVEVALARELEMPVDLVKKLISYRIKD